MKSKDDSSIISELKNDPWISLWLYRFSEYTALFVIVSFFGLLIFGKYQLFQTNTENALYLLSALVQSQAAIVSLVITLTLIAIQMTASSYTPRVVDVLKKNPDMWFLLVIYIESISLGFFVLKSVARSENSPLVSLIFILGIYTFLALFLYMFNTIKLLRPDEVVKMLVGDINVGNIQLKRGTDDIMQPVFDVVHASINRYDVTTTRTGLNQLFFRIKELYPEFDEDARDRIVQQFCEHIKRSSIIAIRNEDEGTLHEILNVLENYGFETSGDMRSKDGFYIIMQVIHFIGIRAADKKLDQTVRDVAYVFKSIGLQYSEKKQIQQVNQIIGELGEIGLHSANCGLMDGTQAVASVLGEIGRDAAGKGFNDTIPFAANHLMTIGIQTSENRWHDPIYSVTSAFGRIGDQAVECGFEQETIQLVDSLQKVGKHAANKKFGDGTQSVIYTLGSIGARAAVEELKNAAQSAAATIGNIGEMAADNRLDWPTRSASEMLELIGVRAADKQLEDVVITSAEALGMVGEHAAEAGLKEATNLAIKSLEVIAEHAADKELERAIIQEGDSFERIFVHAANNVLLESTDKIADVLKNVSKKASDKKMLTGMKHLDDIIERINCQK